MPEHNKMTVINEGNYGEKLYKIGVCTGLAWIAEYGVYAYNEQEACDLLADWLEENESGLCTDYWHLNDLCDSFQSVDEYAGAHNLTCCGNHGVYLAIENITEIKEEKAYNPAPYEKGTTDLIERGWEMKEERKQWEVLI